MAVQGTAEARWQYTDSGRSRHRPTSPAPPTRAVHFDGRDVAEPIAPKRTARHCAVALCSYCGTIRDARFSFGCELAALWGESQSDTPAAGPRVPYAPARMPRVADSPAA